MTDRPRPPRLRPIAPGTVADNVRAVEGADDVELVSRLYQALAELPPDERAAAMVAIGLGEGPAGVAVELDLAIEDADAVTRNALQLLRAAMADIELDQSPGPEVARLQRRHGHRTGRGATSD